MSDDKVVPFTSNKPDPERDAVVAKLNRISLIVEWSAAMRKAGHMPDDVAKAFDEHFGGALTKDPSK